MNARGKGRPVKADEKDGTRSRPNKEEKQNQPLNEARKRAPVGNKGGDSRPTDPPSTKGPLVQQKVRVPPSNAWARGGSSPSFLEIARGKNEVVVALPAPEPESEPEPEPVTFLNGGDTIAVTEDAVDSPAEVQDEVPITMEPPSNNEEPPYIAIQEEIPVVDVPIEPQEEEMEQAPPVKYYVLEIDRIFEEQTVLPPRVTAVASENLCTFTFSGQPGEQPPQLGLPTTQSQHFYRAEPSAAARIFPNPVAVSDITRNTHWNPQPNHGVDLSSMGWRPLESSTRPFHQGMQYNSYGPPSQLPQRNFGPTMSRVRQPDLGEHPLRSLRDSTTINRQLGNGEGVW
ncbi:hypothetical protein, conserved [Trypanosoma brucei gambiense DAL972]|uniref:Uncharacterized protein n=1 Tax=Trypanosoma brucei gambiense (strain MHOM/CI/86/DAL972) TaxID=679716 RepID=D0A0C5_TRYB9|nr:hypothetical protein, conserved [Trypanosoma brucei gambiense DAL972]CBH16683.1 hypothetical protein, conserved [Trypanosoma brucei gambiense DAL972]|eukprot:XP_011778947.1 hypothetical protein, conserved [Trypanosoma brucei gambiense DAL972]